MVDYSIELRRLRERTDNLLLRYGTSRISNPSEEEVRVTKEIKRETNSTWLIAIETHCTDSEDELVRIQETLDQFANIRNHPL